MDEVVSTLPARASVRVPLGLLAATTCLVDPASGQAFQGSRRDPWDAQWDTLLGLIGGALGLALLGRLHDRAMARVAPAPAA